jgi:hypothetical protein
MLISWYVGSKTAVHIIARYIVGCIDPKRVLREIIKLYAKSNLNGPEWRQIEHCQCGIELVQMDSRATRIRLSGTSTLRQAKRQWKGVVQIISYFRVYIGMVLNHRIWIFSFILVSKHDRKFEQRSYVMYFPTPSYGTLRNDNPKGAGTFNFMPVILQTEILYFYLKLQR